LTAEKKSMLKKIDSLIYTTENYDEAVAFFQEKLGLGIGERDDDLARFEVDGFPIFVARAEKGVGSIVSIESDDIAADHKRLEEKGVEFHGPVSTLKSGDKASFFSGPAGAEFMLYQPDK
jgi:predicted enzyme related to lactoylglutathione lyase